MRFLLATIGGGGTVPPPELGLAPRLVRRGHAVRVFADPAVEPGARAARCAFSPWRRAPHVRSVEEQAALMPNIYLRPAPGRPPFGTGWAPARGCVGRIRDGVAAEAIRRLFATGLPAVNTACRAHHLPPVGGLYELLDRCTRVLVMTSASFDILPAALPSNVRYVGPQLDDPPWALMVRTPYAVNSIPGQFKPMHTAQFKKNYVPIVQNERGSEWSQGDFGFLTSTTPDAQDTLDWISAQEWSSGKVGLHGCSSTAENQLKLGAIGIRRCAHACR